AERKRVFARVDDIETIEFQIVASNAHRSRKGRSDGAFDLESNPPSAPHHEQIEICARVSRPEISLIALQLEPANQILDDEPFPRRADLWMTEKRVVRLDPEKKMEKAGVDDLDLGSPDLALSEVLEPRRKLSDHERGSEDVE